MATKFPETSFFLPTKTASLAAALHSAPGQRLVILCHGFTGHKGEIGRIFVHTSRALAKAGLNALRFDFMGSGDSTGDFSQMTPNTQIRDLLDVHAWAKPRYRKIAFLGFSFGGATAICAAFQAQPRPDALLTWSAVPSLQWWMSKPPKGWEPEPGNPLLPGKRFYRDRPKIDVPESYVALDVPRFQIQGDRDNEEFLERFSAYCPKKNSAVRHLVIPGADHVFSQWKHRRQVIKESVAWLKKAI